MASDPQIFRSEMAYRRGFHGGFDAAVGAILAGATPAQLCERVALIAEWREKFGRGEPTGGSPQDPDRRA